MESVFNDDLDEDEPETYCKRDIFKASRLSDIVIILYRSSTMGIATRYAKIKLTGIYGMISLGQQKLSFVLKPTLIPAGMPGCHYKTVTMTKTSYGLPPVANDTISRAVKSGFLNTSTSKSLPQGNTLINSGALLTRVSYFALSCLLTMAVKPS